MTLDDTALLLIDWQIGFRDAAFWGPRCNPAAETNASRLIAAWREAGGPIFHVHHCSVMPGSPLQKDCPGAEPEPFAAVLDGEAWFSKSVNSGFIGTELESALRAAGISKLVISGATTDHCVSTTTRMAANLGFTVQLVGDACFTHDRHTPTDELIPAQQVHDVQLASLHGEFAQVVSTFDVISGL